MTAGHESADHALQASSALDPSALENLHASVVQAAHEYYTKSSITMHTELVELRDKLCRRILVAPRLDPTTRIRIKTTLACWLTALAYPLACWLTYWPVG